MQEKIEVSKKDFFQFQISKKEVDMAKIEDQIAKLKEKKEKMKAEISAIRESNRDLFPARGRKKKA